MNLVRYVTMFIILTTIGMLYDRYSKKYFPDEELDKYDLVRKHLLNEESDVNKPILWVHTEHNINSKHWQSFYSRNSKNLNCPYKKVCIETIVKHCGDSFNVCLIDDSSINKLLPKWSIILDDLSDPIKENIRHLALLKILYKYGGVLIPNTTIVLKNLKSLYNEKIKETDFCVGELVNRNATSVYSRFFMNKKVMFSRKDSPTVKKLIEHLEIIISKDYTSDSKFNGELDRFIYELVSKKNGTVICGKKLGTKDKENNVVLIDHLMMNSNIDFCDCNLYCICIPGEELTKRTKYQWFTRLNKQQILESNTQISKYILISLHK